jgi:formylglycine-generating enzyme required for sulfatase activity
MRTIALLLMGAWISAALAGSRADVAQVDFVPAMALPAGESALHITAFQLDRTPVTNAQFLKFVESHPQWRKNRVVALFADSQYLSHWSGPLKLGPSARASQPVTRISWYAARAYCSALHGRLPTWSEWELVAAADERVRDARADLQWQERILDWYARPASAGLGDVGSQPANVFGIQDLHGLIWEWVEDFGSLMVSGDSRTQGDPDKLAFCGAGALSAQDRENYAILMRIAFLSSLEASSTARSLGFRCAG